MVQPEKVKEVKAWLTKAGQDLRAGGIDLAAQPPLLGEVAFHSQQACEIALKAFLVFHDKPFRKTHDLDVLGAECEYIDPSLKPLMDRARDLTPYAWVFRYPGDTHEPMMAEAEEALKIAQEVCDRIGSILKI